MKEKIALVTEFFLPHIGGQEVRFQELAIEFSNQGYEVHIYTIRYDSSLTKNEIRDNLSVYRIVDDFAYASGGGLRSRSIATIMKFAFSTALHLKKDNYVFIIFNQFPILPIIFAEIMQVRANKLLDFVEFRNGFLWSVIQKLILSSSDKVVCISEGVRDEIEKICNKESHVIPSLVDVSKFFIGEPKHFIFIGRLEPHKHPEDAILAVIRYNEINCTKHKIHIVGGGSLYVYLMGKYSSDPSVFIHGFVNDEEKASLLSESIALILPSEREGLPKSVIEAIASGVPTLTTDYPQNGTKWFVETEKNGIVSIPNVDALTVAMCQIVKENQAFRAICRNLTSNFNVTKGAAKYINIGRGEYLYGHKY